MPSTSNKFELVFLVEIRSLGVEGLRSFAMPLQAYVDAVHRFHNYWGPVFSCKEYIYLHKMISNVVCLFVEMF
jgi:hypothetical protein